MRRISSPSIVLRALLCALVLLLALAPISGAAAATPHAEEGDALADVSATEAPATEAPATEAPATEAPAAVTTAQAAADVAAQDDSAATSAQDTTTQAEQQETTAAAPGGGANQDGPYTSDPNAPETPSGNGNATKGNRPCAGCVGNADDKNPPGQMPGPEDGNQGYECDGNQGVGKGNPAHTGCQVVSPAPAITIVKAHTLNPMVDGQTIPVNGTATWMIRVTNTGNVSLSNVTVTDPLAPGCDRNLGSLAAGASAPAYSCSRAGVPESFTNRADVVGTHSGGTVTASDTAPVTVTTPTEPAIAIVKAHTLNPLVDGQDILRGTTATWMIRVTNTGNVALSNVTVSDPQAPDCDRQLGTLAAGASAPAYSCSLAGVQDNLLNRADVVGTHAGGTVSAFDTAPVTVFTITQTGPASIQLIKSAPAPECPRPGQVVTYRFEIRNTGAQTLSNIRLNDPLLGGAMTLPTTTLAPEQSMITTTTYRLTGADLTAGSVSNTATVTSTGTSGQPVSNTGSAVLILERCPGNIFLEKDGPRQAQVGEQITYTFTVTNIGDVDLTNVRITDPRLGISGLLVNPSTLAPRQQGTATATYVVTEADADAGQILNTAVVRARTPDDSEVEDTDDHRTDVPLVPGAPEPAIRLVKSGPPSASVGETVTYTFTVTNTGDVSLRNVSITDPFLRLNRLRVRPSTLAPDQQGTATATYVITQADADAGSVYNTAVARGRAPDGRTVRDRDDHTITVPLVPPVCPSPPCGPPPPPPPDLPATGLGTTGFALTALLSLALGGVLLGIAGSGNLQAAMANATVNADSPMLALLRQWNLAPKPGGSQARRRRRR